MSYIYSPPRRRRRGVWLLAILSVAVVVVVLVTSFRSERRVLAAYLDAAQSTAGTAAGAAEEFLDLVDRLDGVDRQEFVTSMAGIRQAAGSAKTGLAQAEAPADALDAHARLSLAYSSWLEGLEVLEGAAVAAADDPTAEVPGELVASALLELSVGDRAYEEAVVALAGLESAADVEVPNFPEIVFRPEGGTEALLAAVRASEDLPQQRDLAITAVAFEPRVLSETADGVGVVPYTDRLIVNATVSNIGNEAAASIPVRVVLSSDRTGTSAAESEMIERLEPAESTSLEFVFAVVPVANYELLIDVGGTDGETSLDDNLLVVRFVVNEEG